MKTTIINAGSEFNGGRANPRTDAFTLTELIVVIATLAVLGGLFLSAHAGPGRKASILECKNNLRQVGAAIDAYSRDHQDTLPGPA